MDVLKDASVWIPAPGQQGVDPAAQVAYQVERPTYYSSVAFRDRFNREHGLAYGPFELLGERANGLEAIVAGDEDRAAARMILARAVVETQGGGRLSVEDRGRLATLKLAARKSWPPFREMEAQSVRADELMTLDRVRAFVKGWRNLVAAETGEDLVAETETLEDGAVVLSRASVECIPFGDLVFLARRIADLDRPRGVAKKNSTSPSSGPSTRPPSTASAKSGRQTDRRRKGKGGSSRTSRTATDPASR